MGTLEPKPHLRPTKLVNLLLVLFIAAGVSFLLIEQFYAYWDSLSFSASWFLIVLVAVDLWLVWLVRSKVRKGLIGFGVNKLAPALVARFAIWGKVSAYLGSLLTGFWGAFIGFLVKNLVLQAAKSDLGYAIFNLILSLLLLVVGWWLEFCCRIPPDVREITA